MRVLKDWLTPLTVVVLSGVMIYDHVSPPRMATGPATTVSGVSLGRAYAPTLVASYADGWVAAARALEEGKSVAEAQRTLQDTWKAARVEAFTRDVQPVFSTVLVEGAEPADPAKRSQVAAFWRAFARGLRAGR